MIFSQKAAVSFILLSSLSPISWAQWDSDSTMHQVIADGAGEQVQPKIVATPDGGCYISWYSSQTGYDVRLQRLDASGNEAWAHNGILIADRGFSSTQDYDLDVDTSGHAVLVFRDDRFGGVKITAQRVAPDGTPQWGADGIQFGNGTDFVASPDIASTSDGDTVIAWINESNTNLARIAQDGSTLWTTNIMDPGGSGVNLASMHGSDNGSVIVSWVQFAAFFDPKHLYAQKINADSSAAWGSNVAVFDGGSLQFGNFPEFVSDDSGGAVFSWYDTANGLNVYAQHLASDGSELFSHNGVAASTSPRERVSPSANYDATTDSVLVVWTELDNNQGSQGVSAQRIDATGTRMWTDSGVELTAPDANASSSVNVQMNGSSAVVIWIENAGGFGLDTVVAQGLSTDGMNTWMPAQTIVASDPVGRSRLTSTLSTNGFVIAGWQAGSSNADIETHNINPDGSLGVASCPTDLNGDGDLNFFDVSAFLAAFAANDPTADFNNDGFFNFFDVSAFLTAFAAGCP